MGGGVWELEKIGNSQVKHKRNNYFDSEVDLQKTYRRIRQITQKQTKVK